jgi:hypothetical protein
LKVAANAHPKTKPVRTNGLRVALPRITSIAPVTASQVTTSRNSLSKNIRSRGGIPFFSRVVQLDIDNSRPSKNMSYAGKIRNLYVLYRSSPLTGNRFSDDSGLKRFSDLECCMATLRMTAGRGFRDDTMQSRRHE